MEFLTASPTSHICEYNNHLTKEKIRKEVIEFLQKGTFLKAAWPHSVNRNTYGNTERSDVGISRNLQHSFGDKNE